MWYSINTLRAWLIFGLLAVSLNQSVPKQADKPHTDQNDGEHASGQLPKPAMDGPIPFAGPSPAKEEQRANHEANQPGWCEKILSPVISNWPLLAVAVWGIIVANRTLKAISRQADIMERQTKATENTLVITERPTVVARNFFFSQITGAGGIVNAPSGIQNGSMCLGQFYVANSGGTNAHVREIDCRVWVDAEDGRLPAKRPYEGEVGTKVDAVLSPGKSMPWHFSREQALMHQGFDISTGKTALYVLGRIGYTDDLGIHRWTCFCRKYDAGKERFVPVDDPDYENSD